MNAFFYLLPDDIQLHLKCTEPVITPALGSGCRPLGYKQLLDVGLRAQCALTKAFRIGGHLAHMHQLQPLALYLLDDNAQHLLLSLFILRQKHQTRAIFAFLRYGNTLQQNKLVRNLHHNACSVTVFTNLCTTVPHILQHAQCVIHQLVTLPAMNVNHHTHTAGIVFILALIESLSNLLFITLCHNTLDLTYFLTAKLRFLLSKRIISVRFSIKKTAVSKRLLCVIKKTKTN